LFLNSFDERAERLDTPRAAPIIRRNQNIPSMERTRLYEPGYYTV
jgi:hypothetical protein